MEDSWQLYRNKPIENIPRQWDKELQRLMNKVLPVHEIISVAGSTAPLPPRVLEAKIKRLKWQWKAIRDYPQNIALPVMTDYKKTFPKLSNGQKIKLYEEAIRASGTKNIAIDDNVALYYTAKPFVITVDDLKHYILSKFRLTPTEQTHIFPGITRTPPSTDKSAFLFLNYDPARLVRLLEWLDSDELRYRPGGKGYEQLVYRFQENKKRLTG